MDNISENRENKKFGILDFINQEFLAFTSVFDI